VYNRGFARTGRAQVRTRDEKGGHRDSQFTPKSLLPVIRSTLQAPCPVLLGHRRIRPFSTSFTACSLAGGETAPF